MKLIAKTTKTIKSVLLVALIAAGVVLAVTSIYVWRRHAQAQEVLAQVDLQARNTSGATFYASRKRLFVGQKLTRDDVVAYLATTNFTLREKADEPGTYSLEDRDTLKIAPRLHEFQPTTIKFRNGRINTLIVEPSALNPASGEVRETAIEPEPLGAFVTSMNGDETSRMFVRRYTAQFADFKDSDLFFAILASEDSLFLEHGGTRFDRIFKNLLLWRRGGGSSITMQVIKNAVSLDTTRTLSRKIDEIFLASALEQNMSKEDILTLYVNNVFLGGGKGAPNIYGFLAAAEEYFGKKNLKELTLSETCALVAMLPKPNVFLSQAKAGDYGQLTTWRDRVLDRLNENWPDRYPTSRIDAVRKEKVHFVNRPYVEQPMDILCRAFIDYSTGQHPLVQLQNLSATDYSGLHIYTSVDPDLMREAQRVLGARIPSIERRFPPIKKGGCQGQPDRMLGAIVAIDPRNGEIITMSGGGGGPDGVKYAKFALNATDAPASTIKPFHTVKALAAGRLPGGERYTAASILDPSNASINGWKPTSGLGGVGRPRAKLADSSDDFAVETLKIIGLENGKKFYELVTGNTISRPTGQLALGFGSGTEVSPLRLARAYTIFGNDGFLTETNPISKVYLNGREVENKRKSANQVIDSGAAYIATEMMRSVLGYGADGVRGTARQAFAQTGLDRQQIEIAGKTGSGPNSVWMISVSPKLVVAVWLGYQCHSEIKNSREMYSKDTAALIWAEFIKSVSKFRPDLLAGNFAKPENVTEAYIDPVKGCRTEQKSNVKEYFIKGALPAQCGVK